jgi:hypothetical protein
MDRSEGVCSVHRGGRALRRAAALHRLKRAKAMKIGADVI